MIKLCLHHTDNAPLYNVKLNSTLSQYHYKLHFKVAVFVHVVVSSVTGLNLRLTLGLKKSKMATISINT